MTSRASACSAMPELDCFIEGKLLKPWVEEVRNAFASGTDPSSRINLDLSALTSVDAAGEELLWELIGQGIEVVACSIYVAELLRISAAVRLANSE